MIINILKQLKPKSPDLNLNDSLDKMRSRNNPERKILTNIKESVILNSTMKRVKLFTIMTIAFLSLFILVDANIETEERFGISFPDLPPITMPEVTEYKLDNGTTFLLSEDNSLPTVNITVEINAGSIFDDPDRIGIASITADLLRTGGTKNYSSNELNMVLDNMAISLSSSSRILSTGINMSFLANDKEKAIDILGEVIRYPVFEENALERAKMGANTSISRRNDEVRDIAFREFHKLIYGEDSPYARHTEYETIKNITRDGVIDFHKQHYQPQDTYISVIGDFRTEEMIKLLKQTFGDWENEFEPQAREKETDFDYQGSVNLVSRPDAEQTWIVIGHRAKMTQRHPDYIPMIVLNDILGGGFTSRIYNRIRNQMGLAYAPGAHYSVHLDSYGAFYLMSQTRTDKTVEAIQALIDEIRIIQNEPVTEEELRQAKESYLNSFIFNYDATWKIIRRQMTYNRFGYPDDFLEQVRDNVYDVTVQDIQRVANEYLKPDEFVILAVGNEEEFDQPLSVLGDVNPIDITIPEPAREEKEVTPEQKVKGREIFQQYRQATGTDKEINNIELSGISTQYREGDSSRVYISTYMEFPDRFRQDIVTPRGNLSMIFNQGKSIMATPGGDYPLPPTHINEIINNMRSNPVGLATHFHEEFDISLLSIVQLEGREHFVLSLSENGQSFLLFLDRETMLPYQSVYDDFQQMKTIYTRFSNYEEIDGVIYPMKIITQDENEKILSRSIYETVEFNVEFDEELFLIEN